MAADNQFQLSVIQPTQPAPLTKTARQVVPQFLQKLYEMVSNTSTNHLIKWSDAGDSFIVLDHERFARDVLPRWFKHNNFASFVRQLNMYGFHKIPHLQQGVLKSETETELWNFEHSSFRRNQPDLLCLISRKKQAPDRTGGDIGHGDTRETLSNAAGGDAVPAGTVMDISTVMNGITSLKRHQAAISSELNDLKNSNQVLWQEALAARERHDKHQQTINKILKFLAGVFGNPGSPHHKGSATNGSPHSVIPRRRQPLLIENGKSDSSSPVETLKGNETAMSSVSNDQDSRKEGASIHIVDAPTPSSDMDGLRSPSVNPSMTTPVSDIPTSFTEPSASTSDLPANGGSAFQSNSYSQPTFTSSQSDFASNPSFLQPSNLGASSSTSALPTDMNMLTSTSQQQNAKQEAVLQSILNSPGQLQKLINMMQSQQGMQIPPVPTSTSDNDDPFASFDSNVGFGQRPISPFSLSADVHHPDPQTLSLLKQDDAPDFEPLLENTAQLQKSYKDAASISADVDAMQASIDSLIHDLGLDPNQITTFDATHDHDDPVLSSTGQVPTAYPTPVGVQPSGPPSTTEIPTAQPNAIPDFDIEAFLRELSRQQAEANVGSVDFTNPIDIAPCIEPSGSAGSHLSAFVDEINSNSDASSPPANRVSLADEPVFDIPMDIVGSNKKGRKRKSDVDSSATGLEQIPSKTKRRR